jgi:outer membrane protein assembly factor BamD (BamD/ComL family)
VITLALRLQLPTLRSGSAAIFRKSLCAGALAFFIIAALPQPAAGQQDRKASQSSEQPDKVLLDRAVRELQKKRYQSARLLLQTLINTYQDSEYISKAQLAIAQSWFKEGGSRALAQAELGCTQLIQQFPDSPEANEAAEMLRKIQGPPAPAK